MVRPKITSFIACLRDQPDRKLCSRLPLFSASEKIQSDFILRQASSARGTPDRIQVAPDWNLTPKICDLNSGKFVVGTKTSRIDQLGVFHATVVRSQKSYKLERPPLTRHS